MSLRSCLKPELASQLPSHDSFIGGVPRLPPGIDVPRCTLCRAQQTFFFQVAFPANHVWAAHSLSIFACTSCADKDYLIPEVLRGQLVGAAVPASLLKRYQRNFRFLVFETSRAQFVHPYTERIAYQQLKLRAESNGEILGHIGGRPVWVLDDESPTAIDGETDVHFLLQVSGDLTFPTAQEAPPQMDLNLAGDPVPGTSSYYELFIGNTVYLFGTRKAAGSRIYCITQVD